jgi:hypothetical protein
MLDVPDGAEGWLADYWYPAELRPNECLWDTDFHCIRDDHHHGDHDE